MPVRISSSKPSNRLSSISLEKILETKRNLSKSPPNIWNKPENETKQSDPEQFPSLELNHPILRILESCKCSLQELNQVLTQIFVSGLFQHLLASGRAIKKLCSSPSLIPHAISLFNCLDNPDAFICNTIIRSYYMNLNDPDSAIRFYHQKMVENGVLPNHYTFPLLVKVCAELGSIREGKKAHARIVKLGFESDLFVRNAMIHMYGLFGRAGDARKVFDESSSSDLVTWNSMIDGYVKNGEVGIGRKLFDEMPERDIVSWNSMLAGYVSVEDVDAARKLFDEMPVRDVVSWNSMIDGYARVGNVTAASDLFEQMQGHNIVSWNIMLALHVRMKNYSVCLRLFDRMIEQEVNPNEATLVSVLTSCANLGKLNVGKSVHSYIKGNQRIEIDTLLSTALLTMYAKCGAMDMAREVFLEMPERNVVSWNSMIRWYGMHGHVEKALEMFLEMEKNGPTPNDVTFICVLSACAHAGLVLEGWWYFDLMQRTYKIKPKVEHYGCMIDLLGRAGLMSDSEDLINKMPMEAGPTLWSALMSACSTHSNFKLAEIVGKRLIDLDPENVGPYVLLSNIYAMESKWDDVENVRKMIKEKGLHKSAGFSMVQLAGSNRSESFLEDGHGSNHRKNLVYSMLTKIGTQMKLSCRDSDRDVVGAQ